MTFTTHKNRFKIWLLGVVVFGSTILGSFFFAKASAETNRLASINARDTLILLVELATESGDEYTQVKTLFVELFQAYAEHMERRDLYWLLQLPTFSNKNVAKELKRLSKNLEATAQINTRKSIDETKDAIAKFLTESKPFTDEPITTFEPEAISKETQNLINTSLDKAHEKTEIYVNDPNMANSRATCMANRKAIVCLFLARFNYQEIVDEEELRSFRTDINRTIHNNQLLQQTYEEDDPNYKLLGEYSDSELRRLRLLQAIIDNDIQQAQFLLQISLKKAFPNIQFLAAER